jgi:F-type H+-transporting ATPase subunit delta
VADEPITVSAVAERYASALFELARDEGTLDPVATELNNFASLLNESDDLTRLVKSPVFTSDEQVRAVTAVLDKAGIKGLAANLIKIAAANRRLFAVPEMIIGYRKMLAKERGEISASVTSAEPLTETQWARTSRSIRRSTLP